MLLLNYENVLIESRPPQDRSFRRSAYDTIMELLQMSLPSKGEPFPKINGPKPNEKVCIVGAGPAGIHMATRLKEREFRDITILESTDRVGGKSYDTKIDGFYHAQGTIFLQADYFENIVKLARKYNVGEVKALDASGVCMKYCKVFLS